MSAIDCDTWRIECLGDSPQVGSDATATPSAHSSEGPSARSPRAGGAHPGIATGPSSGALSGPTPTIALALATLFPDLTPTALQHMLGLG